MTKRIHFHFDERKAADAAAYMIQIHGGRMNHMLLLKLLYAAERESLKRRHRPIFGDRYVSMQHGPVVSRVYNLIKEERDFPAWAVLIEKDSATTVRLLIEPPLLSLSDTDRELLDAAKAMYPNMNQYQVRDSMHQEFSEWQDPGGSSKPISVESMLAALNKSPVEVEHVRNLAEEDAHFKKLFGA